MCRHSEADFIATAQQFGMAVVVEMIIVMSMVASELLAHARKPEVVAPREMKIVLPAKPKLVTATNKGPAGSVVRIMTGVLEPTRGEKLELADAYRAYAEGCGKQRPLDPEQFADALKHFCQECGIAIRRASGHVYLMNVRCAARRRPCLAMCADRRPLRPPPRREREAEPTSQANLPTPNEMTTTPGYRAGF